MPDITPDQVKRLRDLTGAGMMDCKKALEESGGDIEAAVVLLLFSMSSAPALMRGISSRPIATVSCGFSKPRSRNE